MWGSEYFTPERLADFEKLIERFVELRAKQAQLDAEVIEVLGEFGWVMREFANIETAFGSAEYGRRMVSAEVGTAVRINDRAMARMISNAMPLFDNFPDTLAALSAGKISARHAYVIAEESSIISEPNLLGQYEAAVLPYAQEQTTNRLRPIAKRLAARFSQSTLEERHEVALLARDVSVKELPHGMAELIATLPAVQAFGIKDRLTKMARAADPTGRSILELRADLLVDLLLTGHPAAHTPKPLVPGSVTKAVEGTPFNTNNFDDLDSLESLDGLDTRNDLDLKSGQGCVDCNDASGLKGLGAINAEVMVTIPLLALLPQEMADKIRQIPGFENIGGLEGSADLAGYGPIDSQTARQLAQNAKGWNRIMVEPISGAVQAVDRYTPSKKMKRTLNARDLHCRFPGCRIPANRCDKDHTVDWAHDGPTQLDNLENLCRFHHTYKHNSGWAVEQLDNGTLKWVSLLGRTYIEEPPSNINFKPVPVSAFDFDGPPPF